MSLELASSFSTLMGSNGSRYRRLEGRELAHETDKIQNHEKSQFGGVNPAVRVHAVLGSP